MAKHCTTFIYESSEGAQIAVEVWPDGIDVKLRPTKDAIWGLPLPAVYVEGPAVSFEFKEEVKGNG